MSGHSLISDEYRYPPARTHLSLSAGQIRLRDAIQQKIDSGYYALEHRACLCGSGDAVVIAETDRYGFKLRTVICKACGIVRTDPRINDRSLREFYASEYQDLYFDSGASSIEAHFRAQRTNGLYARDFFEAHCRDVKPNRMSVVEIGCSAGGILKAFCEAGAVVRGYDYNRRYLEYGKSVDARLDLRYGGIGDLGGDSDRVDLVIMNHVIEHLADPVAAIQYARNMLKDGGILYLSVPGIMNPQYYNSPVRSYLGSLHIAHLYHFTRNSLLSIADDFEPIFVDDKVRGVFRLDPGRKAPPFPREYDRNLRYITWRERSLSGAMARTIDCVLHDHHLYTRAAWALRSLKNLRKR